MSQHNCPNCGAASSLQFQLAKMATCGSCSTSLFLDDGRIENAGTSGDFHDGPMLLRLGDRVPLLGVTFHLLGHARFDYGPGWWDEFWAVDDAGEGAWISIDEGEVIVQRPVTGSQAPDLKTAPELAEVFAVGSDQYRVAEADEATCIGVRGEFPELLRVGQRYSFVNCLSEDGDLLSGEFSDGLAEWYQGVWIDPFDIAAVTQQ